MTAIPAIIKTFDDLAFQDHNAGMGGFMARMHFPNGYGVSVVRFGDRPGFFGLTGSHTSNDNEWEVAILKNNKLCYSTPLTDDVLGHCEADRVTEIMAQVQALDPE